jgi:hypothetical protein
MSSMAPAHVSELARQWRGRATLARDWFERYLCGGDAGVAEVRS